MSIPIRFSALLERLAVPRDPDHILIQCLDPKSNIGNVLIDPMRGTIPYR